MSTRRVPAEWEPAAQLLLTWPHAGQDWGDALPAADAAFLKLARAAAPQAPLLIAADPRLDLDALSKRLHEVGVPDKRVRLIACPSDDVWARDHGPLTRLDDGQATVVDFDFNAWGGKYAFEADRQITARLHEAGGFGETPRLAVDWVLEGGAIDVDGRGTVLTTPACLQDTRRNADASRERAESLLAQHLGAERIWWLDAPSLMGDDTDGHIDTLVRFAPDGSLLVQGCETRDDPHHGPLRQLHADLAQLSRGQHELVTLPLPAPVLDTDGRRLPASYANLLFLNGAVLVPTYGDPADEVALRRIEQASPGHRICPVDARTLVRQNGSLHCVTMQIAASQTP